MYWPCGVPRVYAHHDRNADTTNGGDEDQGSDDHAESEAATPETSTVVLGISTTRTDFHLASITATTLHVWSTRPTVVLATHHRSSRSLQSYGANVNVYFKPDSSTVVVQTAQSYLLTFIVESDSGNRVLQQNYAHRQSRRQSVLRQFGTDEGAGVAEVLLRFRRSIKIDAGISSVLASDTELVVSTSKPAAVQCIRWESQRDGPQAQTQLLSRLDWIDKTVISFMTYEKGMNLAVWVGKHGAAYAVQKLKAKVKPTNNTDDSDDSGPKQARLFEGYCFHEPEAGIAYSAAINARFSLIALAMQDGSILCYAAKDYVGNIPLSHTFRTSVSSSTTGSVTSISWSPDGYCLFVGYKHGWATWSVFGKEGASTFQCNSAHAENHDERWLLGVRSAVWLSGGAEMLLTAGDDRIWVMEMSRSAAMGCFSCANLVRALLQTPTEVTIYRGHEMPDLSSIVNKASLWHRARFPAAYLQNQWPIKSCVVSQDGRYVAVAGRRGLAHYSLQSSRWKTFSDLSVENSFAVRGGMCWFHHVLAAASESAEGYELRLYSRELDLGRHPLHAESFAMPIVFVGPSGEDSLLVYTYENVLYHYVINISAQRARLVQVGQIAFHGVVRAPSRVRSVSWIVPDHQLRNGDPSRDVEFASVLFLVDDKLVVLQPSRTPDDELRYDLRVIAQHVEYYILMRDQIFFNFCNTEESAPPTPSPGSMLNGQRSQAHSLLRDSLWIFSGNDLRLWPDVKDVLYHAAEGDLTTKAPLLSVPVDFYPLSVLLNKGVVLGIEGELLQRRNVSFAQWRTGIRTQLFLPYILRHQLLTANDTTAAFGLANQFQHLSYFPHALEILLHHVLDDEQDRKQGTPESADPEPLPAVLSFLQMVLSPSAYLSTLVSCVRKTELSYWSTLFVHLPPPLTLFEEALQLADLKTASGFLIILQGLEEDDESDTFDARKFESYVVRLMTLAKEQEDFGLCSELARFMMGIDPRGDALRRVVESVGFRREQEGKGSATSSEVATEVSPLPIRGRKEGSAASSEGGRGTEVSAGSAADRGDYFTTQARKY